MSPVLARAVSADHRSDVELAFDRMALPPLARDYLFEKFLHQHVLLTGLEKPHGQLLRALAEDSTVQRDEYPQFVAGDQRTRPGTALLSGRRDQFERLLGRLAAEPAQASLATALQQVLGSVGQTPGTFRLGDRTLDFAERTYVMGVVNVTPDSFSDGGRFFDRTAAIDHALALAGAGADILDIGGESTRPGSGGVSADEELARVLPVITALRRQTDVPLSVDTTKAKVAKEALAAGASMVNDISGFHFDADLPRVAAAAGAACCLMHIRGTPETMQKNLDYDDVVAEVAAFLEEGIASAAAAGIGRERILVDPGIGFGKTVAHNLYLLRRLADLRPLAGGVLVGTSRKSFLGAVLGGKPPGERLYGTVGSVAAVVALGGADVVRVHDVAEVRDALAVAQAVRCSKDGGSSFARPVAAPEGHA